MANNGHHSFANRSAPRKGTEERAAASPFRSRLQKIHRKASKVRHHNGKDRPSDFNFSGHIDAKSLALPAINIIALVLFAIIATWQISAFRHDIEGRIKVLDASLAALQEKIFAEAKNNARTKLAYFSLWCRDTEALNRKAGWRCADFKGLLE